MKGTLLVFLLAMVGLTSAIVVAPKTCHRVIDLVFVLDASNSISRDEFAKQIPFVTNLVSYFDVGSGEDKTKIALVTFGSSPAAEFNLNKFDNKKDMRIKIQSLRHPFKRNTNIHLALSFVEHEIFTTANGARSDSQKIVILITDGNPQNKILAIDFAKKLTNDGVSIFTIGVGDKVKRDVLEKIASTSKQYKQIANYKNLPALVKEYKTFVCPDVNECDTENGGCAHMCTNINNGYECSCKSGFREMGKQCADINECAKIKGGCKGTCENTDGSFRCGCDKGYVLENDGITCKQQCKRWLDLIFAIDMSTSVKPKDFAKEIMFAKDLSSRLSVGQGVNQTRVGLVLFSTDVNVKVHLKDMNDISDLNSKFEELYQIDGDTNTDGALKAVRTKLLTTKNGARSGARQVLVVLTDGVAQREANTKVQADKLKENEVIIYVIAIGKLRNSELLKDLASSSDTLIKVENFDELQSKLQSFESETCQTS